MVRDTKIEIIGRETVRPSSPIPHNLKTLKLSLFDQLAPPSYVRLILFYSNINNNDVKTTDEHHQIISQQLKKSLSESLTRFYPFAGRLIKSGMSIDFDDHGDNINHGAHYIEARIHHPLSSFLEQPDIDVLKHFHLIEPHHHQSSEDASSIPLLQVQVSFFDCGGLAIGLCMSHKLTDAATMSKFIGVWAAIAFGHGQAAQTQQQRLIPFVDFNAASYFPPREHLSAFQPPTMIFKVPNKCVKKRYVFDGTKIKALREKAMSPSVQRPSRVEAVTALIWRCAMAAAWKKSTSSLNNKDAGDSKKKSIIIQLVNIRKRVKTPFLENTMGNLVQHFAARTEESQMELQDLVAQLRKGNIEFGENIEEVLGGDELLEMIDQYRKDDEKEKKSSTRDVDGEKMMKLYSCSSWCRFGLYDAADFGWGKPIWMTTSGNNSNNSFLLMDTKGGDGIEALITLSEEEMELFEKDTEFLTFASSNPSV